ncbi:hypothetical protein JKP88DRAFT_278573 [Tribonema minus]|uniref:Uncharacterized protein n=1 Tax=Tribonema minus TaxID=303371 RepID=A0A835YYL8_9STRA|nr:hypothetical protein JKP88DRAFT_278573 [Tribonema minus]
MLRSTLILVLCAVVAALDADPKCLTGVPAVSPFNPLGACCPKKCGDKCGARDCESRGADDCCPAYIKKSGRTCEEAGGILGDDGKSCCAASCGECGGFGCHAHEGGVDGCCKSAITAALKSCRWNDPPCLVVASPQASPEPTPTHTMGTRPPAVATEEPCDTPEPTVECTHEATAEPTPDCTTESTKGATVPDEVPGVEGGVEVDDDGATPEPEGEGGEAEGTDEPTKVHTRKPTKAGKPAKPEKTKKPTSMKKPQPTRKPSKAHPEHPVHPSHPPHPTKRATEGPM